MTGAKAPMARRKRPVDRRTASWPKPVPVKDWMGQPAVTIRAGASVHDAIELMKARRIRHLPVVDSDARLVGILTDRDVRQMLFDPSVQESLAQVAGTLEDWAVSAVMTWAVITVGPHTDLRQAVRVMLEQKLGALPVVDRGRVVGVLTERDALRALEAHLRNAVTTVRPLEAARASGGYYEYGFAEPSWAEPAENQGDPGA